MTGQQKFETTCDLRCNSKPQLFADEREAIKSGWLKLTFANLYLDRDWFYRWVCPQCAQIICKNWKPPAA